MGGVTFSIVIDAPPERVFEHLADVAKHPTWANPKADMTMQQTAGTGPGPDSAYRSSGVFVGKPVSADISVTAYDPPRRFTIRSDQHQEGKKDVWYVNDYTLTADGTEPASRSRSRRTATRRSSTSPIPRSARIR
jgi:uncharacterized protein YndB with AHSA1/START domain